jgi:CheY-like chemotaxis protein
VLTKAVEMSSPLLEQRRHRLAVDVAEGLHVHGDPVRLAQVVSNLLTNAARYTAAGGEIGLAARPEGDGEVLVSVRDNGIGIDPEMLPRIFDLFFQVGRDGDAAEGGLGIGLALVKSLVALHEGSVVARSDGPGQGSEFVIRIPVAANEAAREEGDASTCTGAGSALQPEDCLRILLVDDNADAAETLGQLLASVGHEVKVANDPVTALRVARDWIPDVSILDIAMPGMDGYELAARLRERPEWSACRFLALTGFGQDGDRTRSDAAGFAGHLVKPVSPAALLRLTAEMARSKRALLPS